MSIGTPTLTTISIETKPSRKCRRGDRSTKRVRVNGSIVRSTAKACRIAIRGRRKNSIARAAMTRSSRGNLFAAERKPADRISAVATDRRQRIVVEQARSAAELEVAAAQANSAVVVEQIEAALVAAAAPFKGSEAAEARQRARASAVARAGRAVARAGRAVAEDRAAAGAAVEVAGSDALANRVR